MELDDQFIKNGEKPKDDPNSYRRITVTSTIRKVIETLHLHMNQKSKQ